MISQHRFTKEILCSPVIVESGRLLAQFIPFLNRAVTTTEPSQSDKVDLLVFGQCINK